VNGSMGKVMDIVWPAEPTKRSIPEFVVVDFRDEDGQPTYHGPPFPKKEWLNDKSKRTWVPIAPSRQPVDCPADKRKKKKRGTVHWNTRRSRSRAKMSQPLHHSSESKEEREQR
jgi:hypothetical protein